MTFTSRVLAVLTLAVAMSAAGPSASARTVSAEYSVKIRGIPVGRAEIVAEIVYGNYSMRFTGGVRGLARIFSDAATSVSVTGSVGADRLLPKTYSHLWTEDRESETVAMRFSGRGVTAITLDPPRRRPERYVPFTAATKADALDPVSAFLWPAGDIVTPEACDRTLPLVDGRRRFDIALTFARHEAFRTRDRSFSSPVVVCAFRYTPVAGHRIGKASDASISESDDMEVWMAPVGKGFAVPVRIQLHSRAGRIVLEAIAVRTA